MIEFLTDTDGVLVKKIKANFKTLGKRYGKLMKQLAAQIGQMTSHEISEFEKAGTWKINVDGQDAEFTLEDVEITSEDIPGWLVANEGKLTVALDIQVTPELREEGIAREFINRIQNIRKDSGFDVTDKIVVKIAPHDAINSSIEHFGNYIGQQTLANEVKIVDGLNEQNATKVDIDEEIITFVSVAKA